MSRSKRLLEPLMQRLLSTDEARPTSASDIIPRSQQTPDQFQVLLHPAERPGGLGCTSDCRGKLCPYQTVAALMDRPGPNGAICIVTRQGHRDGHRSQINVDLEPLRRADQVDREVPSTSDASGQCERCATRSLRRDHVVRVGLLQHQGLLNAAEQQTRGGELLEQGVMEIIMMPDLSQAVEN